MSAIDTMPSGIVEGGPLYLRNATQAWRVSAEGIEPINQADLPAELEWHSAGTCASPNTGGTSL